MKTQLKDFWIPYSFEERRPALLDQLLYIPPFYDKHESIFTVEKETFAEFCSGNGEWVIEKAKAYPDIQWIAVEIRFDRARKIWVKAKNWGVKNLFVVFGDARTFCQYYLKENALSKIFINFPDPWPKKRHAKHRLFQPDFVGLMSRALQPKGELILATDDPTYSANAIQTVLKNQNWKSTFDHPYYVHEWPNYGSSYFNTLWCEKGRNIHYHQFVNEK